MISFFPDLNVWVALSDQSHVHSAQAWEWFQMLPREARLIFSRYTHIGLLRLLTSGAVMGPATLTLEMAWRAYDTWLSDPRVEFYPEPGGLEAAFRDATTPFAAKPAFKAVGDCYLLAFSKESQATLVTFDRGLLAFARKNGYAAIMPA
jgi:toxin-antitoxin system PIN domain toxin